MKILVTGTAGFIGFHLAKLLLARGYTVIGLDNINGYYDVKLKFARLQELGISQADATPFNIIAEGKNNDMRFRFIRMNIEDREKLPKLFRKEKIDIVCHMAAQAGVRFSIDNPEPYIDSNVVGFLNLLECARNFNIKHLIYASSSSVYGLNKEVPFSEDQKVDTPISLYAATKKSNELLAHAYSYLFKLPTTGLRFFTVYGPWGRPDMALFLFTEALLNKKPLKVFNNGRMERDFTYIDDVVNGIADVTEKSLKNRLNNLEYYKVFNLGNNKAVRLLDFITALENVLGIKSVQHMMPMQPGDIEKTWADVSLIKKEYDYKPNTDIEQGVTNFVNWYKEVYLNL